MSSSNYVPPSPPATEHSVVPEQSTISKIPLLSEIEDSLQLLIDSAADYDSLHENSSRRICSQLVYTQYPVSDVFSKSAVAQLPLATALLRTRKLCEYGIIPLSAKPAHGDILYRSRNRPDDPEHWIRETQKECLAFLIPGEHPDFPKGRTWRLIERLVLHPDLVTFSQPLVAKKGEDEEREQAHYVDIEHHTPGFTNIEVSFHLTRLSKEETLMCQGHGIWSVDSINFPLAFPNLEIEVLGNEKVRRSQLVLVFVTTREWTAIESLFEIVDKIFVGEGYRAVWMDRGDSPLVERNIEIGESNLWPSFGANGYFD